MKLFFTWQAADNLKLRVCPSKEIICDLPAKPDLMKFQRTVQKLRCKNECGDLIFFLMPMLIFRKRSRVTAPPQDRAWNAENYQAQIVPLKVPAGHSLRLASACRTSLKAPAEIQIPQG